MVFRIGGKPHNKADTQEKVRTNFYRLVKAGKFFQRTRFAKSRPPIGREHSINARRQGSMVFPGASSDILSMDALGRTSRR